MEIIDCNFRIDVNSQGWTQEKIDEADRRDRAALEEKAKELEVCIFPDNTSNG